MKLKQTIICCDKEVPLFDDSDTVPNHDTVYSTFEDQGLRSERKENVFLAQCESCKKEFEVRTDFRSSRIVTPAEVMSELFPERAAS
jgi:hypothetical protein